jgi:hypothetical protein
MQTWIAVYAGVQIEVGASSIDDAKRKAAIEFTKQLPEGSYLKKVDPFNVSVKVKF